MNAAAEILAAVDVIVAVVVLGGVAWQLGRWSDQDPAVWVLRERAISALSLQFLVSVLAAVFVNNEQPSPFFDREATGLIVRGTVALLVIPAIYWVRLSWNHRDQQGPADDV